MIYIPVSSGKGGVGKSTLTANLAVAMKMLGVETGYFDVDFYGPSGAILFSLTEDPVSLEDKLIPPKVYGIEVFSLGSMIHPEEAVAWRGPQLEQVLRRLMDQIQWEAQVVFLDMPPGTGDIPMAFQEGEIFGTVLVTTPQEMALSDVRRAISLWRSKKVPLLGLVENMTHIECPKCQHQISLYGDSGGKDLADILETNYLGSLPFYPRLSQDSDLGSMLILEEPTLPISQAFLNIAEQIKQLLPL